MKQALKCIVFLLWVQIVSAQEPVAIHLTRATKLPDKEIYNLLEDSKGFIWLAADSGLYRYDGKEYRNFSHQKQRGLSVFEPFQDPKGRIWL